MSTVTLFLLFARHSAESEAATILGLSRVCCVTLHCILCGAVMSCSSSFLENAVCSGLNLRALALQEYSALLGRHLHRMACSAAVSHQDVSVKLQAAAAGGVLLCLLDMGRLAHAEASVVAARMQSVLKVRGCSTGLAQLAPC